MAFVVSITRVLALVDARFATRILVIHTAPATTRLQLARKIFHAVMAAMLDSFASSRHRGVSVSFSHLGFRGVMVERKDEGCFPMDSRYRIGV